jgi:hypothetical protein
VQVKKKGAAAESSSSEAPRIEESTSGTGSQEAAEEGGQLRLAVQPDEYDGASDAGAE